MGFIKWVKQNHIVFAVLWQPFKNFFNRITMRVYETQPMPMCNILQDHIDNEICFAHAWLSKHIQTASPFYIADGDFFCCSCFLVCPITEHCCKEDVLGKLLIGYCHVSGSYAC